MTVEIDPEGREGKVVCVGSEERKTNEYVIHELGNFELNPRVW